jgi:hypothetical protein
MTHDQIDRMVRKANPVRDPHTLGPVDVPVLTTPLERRTEMQIDDRPGTEVPADRNRRRGPLVGIAAAAVILIAGLVLFLTRDNTPVAEPAPNATPISAEFDEDSPLAPGAYFADSDGDESTSTGGTFVIEGSGWTSVPSHGALKTFEPDYVGLMVVEVDEVYSEPCVLSGDAPMAAGSTATELANQFAANGFTVREGLAPVNAFGHDGHHLVTEVPAGCADSTFQVWNGGHFQGRYYQGDGQVLERWFLDVDGSPVMVEATWFPSSPEEDVTELHAVLDTLVITP